MAILCFPKNPVLRAMAESVVQHPAETGGRPSAFGTQLARITLLALMHTPLLSGPNTALAQTTGAATQAPPAQAAPAVPSPAPAPAPANANAGAASALWTRPVAPAAWTVTFKYGTAVAPQQAAHRPSMVKVTVLGKDALETIHYPDRTAEVWRTEGTAIISETGSEHAGIRVEQGLGNFGGVGGNNDLVGDLSRDKKGNFTATINGVVVTGNVAQENPDWAEFKEFDWVTPEMFKGKIEISGEKLLVYSDLEPETPAPAAPAAKGRAAVPTAPKFPPGPLGGLPLKPGIRVAAIEETSKIPRYLQMGENIQIYAFSKPQQTKLELPPKITNLVSKPTPPPEGAKAISLIP